ncbi:hypothetical protein [Candidatus Leptofilum sp.]|uniref:hypothetical protein n=1 Tax=Candidatus Leptofilum sp. TaxID=3241576 RepID=UPI003B58D65D
MRARMKRWFKRLLKMGGVFVLIGIGVIIGLTIGGSSAAANHTIVVRGDHHFDERMDVIVEERIHERIEQRIEEEIVVDIPPIPTMPPIPTVPPIPEMPEIPPMPDIPTTIHIERGGPSFFDVVNGIGTILASFGLIGLGIVMILRGRRQPKEKSPESLNQ